MNLLLSAYACDPHHGSEPGVGWQVLLRSLTICDEVVLLTRGNNVDVIVDALPDADRDRLHIVGFDLPETFRRAKKFVPGGTQLYYLAWQLAARRRVAAVVAAHRIDLAHHITFAVDWMPTALDGIATEIPVIWGPVGGASNTPWSLLRTQGLIGAGHELLRRLINMGGRRVMARHIVRRYALCVSMNDDVQAWLSRIHDRVVCEPNSFFMGLPGRDPADVDPDLLVGVGRLETHKAWSIAIRALTHLPESMRFEIFGVGPDEKRLRRIARRHGVAHRVTFRGKVPRADAWRAMAKSRAMLFPSLHDQASQAVGEALTIGCPVVALPLGGNTVMLERSGTRPVEMKRDVYRSLAQGVFEVPAPRPGAWSTERLDQLLRHWYSSAGTRPAHESEAS